MSNTSNKAWILLAATMLAAPAALVTGCGDDDPPAKADASAATDAGAAADASTTADGSVAGDASAADTSVAGDTGVTADASATDTSAAADATVAADTSATTDATAATTVDNGTYTASVWTCTGAGAMRNVKAFAATIGIDEVRFTVNGMTGQTEAIYSGAPPCTRTLPFTITYPSAGTMTTTLATMFMCSPSCQGAKCTPGSQPAVVDTFAFTKTANAFTATRTLGTPAGLQMAAGCQAGEVESVTYTKL